MSCWYRYGIYAKSSVTVFVIIRWFICRVESCCRTDRSLQIEDSFPLNLLFYPMPLIQHCLKDFKMTPYFKSFETSRNLYQLRVACCYNAIVMKLKPVLYTKRELSSWTDLDPYVIKLLYKILLYASRLIHAYAWHSRNKFTTLEAASTWCWLCIVVFVVRRIYCNIDILKKLK